MDWGTTIGKDDSFALGSSVRIEAYAASFDVYLQADQQGNTLPTLVQREGRGAIEQRVTQQAQQDPVFAHNLGTRPRQTLEAFLGVKIPETVSLTPIIENPQRFGLVIPMANNNQPLAE